MSSDNSVIESDVLDVSVSKRQAFGRSYQRPKNLEETLAIYKSGKLVLPPHPVWNGSPIDWTADPFQDSNWRFQHHTLRWLNPLRWAALEGDTDAGAEWKRVVTSWAEANVPASKSQSDFSWRDMVDGNRSIHLSLGAPLVGPEEWYLRLLEYHRDWLLDEAHIARRNHGLHQHAGLFVVGATLRDRSAMDTAVSRMVTQFKTTFDEQGGNDEGSSAYHQHNMTWWSQAWKRVELEGIEPPTHIMKRFDAAANALAHLSMPDGQLPQIGDAARGKIRPEFSESTEFIATGGSKGSPPKTTTLILDRGYIASRSGWGKTRPLAEESHILIRYGKDLRAHSHYDRGSVHLYAGGQRWLVDSGFHSYNSAATINKYLKSREAHNLVSIVGRKHDNEAPVDLVESHVTKDIHDFTLLDRGYGKDALYRRVFYVVEAECWIISDYVQSGERLQISQTWMIEPGVTPRVRDNGFRLDGRGKTFGMYWLGRNVNLALKRAEERSHEAWVGTKWKMLQPGSKLKATSRGSQGQLVTLMGLNSPEPLSVIESRLSSSGNILLYIARGERKWQIKVANKNVTVRRS